MIVVIIVKYVVMKANEAVKFTNLSKIYQKIQQACINGKYEILVDKDLVCGITEQLKDDGYSLSGFSQFSDNVTISWKQNKSQYD